MAVENIQKIGSRKMTESRIMKEWVTTDVVICLRR